MKFSINRHLMYLNYRTLICLLFLVISSPAEAKQITEVNINDLLGKLSNLMNSRNVTAIKPFYEFYADSEARFIKTTYIIGADNADVILANEGVNLSLGEYILSLEKTLHNPAKYYYKQAMTEYKIAPSGTDGTISYHVDEIGFYNSHATSNPIEEVEKMVSSANCNMNIQLAGSGLKIMGINCIEKMAKKTLEINDQ